jgi:hypothetical protein
MVETFPRNKRFRNIAEEEERGMKKRNNYEK